MGRTRRSAALARRPLLIARTLRTLVGHVGLRGLRTALGLVLRGDLATLRAHVSWLLAAQGGEELLALDGRTPVLVEAEPWPPDIPLASIVVVSTDPSASVRDTVDSVLSQTVAARSEVIVVDEGREGRRDGRNLGVEQARGRYVACIHAGDLLDPTYVEVALYLLERRGYDIVRAAEHRASGKALSLPRRPDLRELSQESSVSATAVYRRSLWERAGGYPEPEPGSSPGAAEWTLWARMAALGARVIDTPEPLVRRSAPRSRPEGSKGPTEARSVELDARTEAQAKSERRRRLEVTVEGAFENLRIAEVDHRPTILLALPYLIVGGAERLLSGVARHLSSSGFRVIVVSTLSTTSDFGDSTSWFRSATSEIYHLPRLLHPQYAADFLGYLVDAKHVDVLLVVGSDLAYRQLQVLRERHPSLRVADLLFNAGVHMETSRRYATHIDLHLCENAEVRDLLLAHGAAPDSVALAESGVEISERRDPEPRSGTDRFRVGFSGRLAEEKAPLAFVDVAASVDDPRFEFVITGAGPLEWAVRRKLVGVPNASYLGVVDDIQGHLASLDVLIVPSVMDGRPVVVLEALALGVPVIASRVGGLPALVRDGETGFLVEPGDTDAIARHVRRLAAEPGELQALRASARAFAERNLDVNEMNRAYEDAVRALIVRPA